MAKQEGYGRPGKIPTSRNNPLNLRHSPHSSHEGIGPDDIGIIDTIEHGWEDAERQLQLYASRGLTLERAIYTHAPPMENNSAVYLRNVAAGLRLPIDTPMTEVLKIPAV
jgi:hypothetical protein